MIKPRTFIFSSVSKVTGYELEDRESILDKDTDDFLRYHAETMRESMGIGRYFLGVQRAGYKSDHSVAWSAHLLSSSLRNVVLRHSGNFIFQPAFTRSGSDYGIWAQNLNYSLVLDKQQ
jgi:hypothetical protein